MSHRVRMSMPRRGDRGVWTSHSVVRQKNNVKYTRRNTPWSRTAAGRGLRGCHTLALHDASMDVLRADASRLVGPAAESLAEEAAAAMLRVQEMRPKKTNPNTLKRQAIAAVAAADKVCRAVTGAPTNSTVQLMSAAIRSSHDNYEMVNTTGDPRGAAGIAPSVYEQERAMLATSAKPCLHCGETFDGPPFMIRVPHPDKRRKHRMWGNFCSAPCMVGFTAERNSTQGLETAHAYATAREVYGITGDLVAAAESWAMRSRGGPFAPMRAHNPEQVVERIRGTRFVPECAMFICATRAKRFAANGAATGEDAAVADAGGGGAMDSMALMFSRNNYNPQGLRRPPPHQRPRLAPKRVRTSMARQFCDAVAAGMRPDDIEVDVGLERRTTVSVRRSNIGTVEGTSAITTEAEVDHDEAKAAEETATATKKKRKRKHKHMKKRTDEERLSPAAHTKQKKRRRSTSRSRTTRPHKKQKQSSAPPRHLISTASAQRMALGVASARSGGTKRGVRVRQMRSEAMLLAVHHKGTS